MKKHMLFRVLTAAALGAALLSLPVDALAQRRDEAALLRRRVVLLEDRVVALERQIERLEQLLTERQRSAAAADVAPAGLGALPVPFRDQGWRYEEAWRRLRRGDSQLDVRLLLGQPARIAAAETETVWYYPSGGVVHFSAIGERVEGWREP